MERLAYDDFEVVLERVAAGLTARVSSSPVGPTRPEPVVMPGVDVDGLRKLVQLMNETRGVARHERAGHAEPPRRRQRPLRGGLPRGRAARLP